MDVPNVTFVGQWRVTCNMDTLWQRFGRVARGFGTEGVAILFAEDKYFDDAKEKARQTEAAKKKAQEVKAKKAEKRKRQANVQAEDNPKPQKRSQTKISQSVDEHLQPITNHYDSTRGNSRTSSFDSITPTLYCADQAYT